MKKMSQGWDWAGEVGRSFVSEDSMEVGERFSKAAPVPGGCRWCGRGIITCQTWSMSSQDALRVAHSMPS